MKGPIIILIIQCIKTRLPLPLPLLVRLGGRVDEPEDDEAAAAAGRAAASSSSSITIGI